MTKMGIEKHEWKLLDNDAVREFKKQNREEYHDFIRNLHNEFEKCLQDLVDKTAKENNVDEETAIWLIQRNLNLRWDTEEKDNKMSVVLHAEPKSIGELLAIAENETEYDKKMEKRLIEQTCGGMKK